MKLSAHFLPNDANKKQIEEDIFKTPSYKNWLPKNTHRTIETFIDFTSKEIDMEKLKCINMTLKHNLTPTARKELYELPKRNVIIISNAAKGGTVVIQDVKDYIKEAERQLVNKEYYKMLVSGATEVK